MRRRVVAAAAGREAPDLLLKDARLVNVFTGEAIRTNVAVAEGLVAGIGPEYRHAPEVFDLGGRYLLPGLMDGHVHIESSGLTPARFAEAVVPRGTTAVVADPHEIANVLGREGMAWMLRAAEGLPLEIFFMVPSCVPASDLETAGARLDAEEVARFLKEDRLLGLAEVMDYPGVVGGKEAVLAKIAAARAAGKPVDGHAPGLRGPALSAYAAAGIGTDHECTDPDEAQEKLRLGLRIFVREGSFAKDLESLVRILTPETSRRCVLVTDDVDARDLVRAGHVDALLRRAVRCGIPEAAAVSLVTLNAAEAFGLRGRGAVAPGYAADLVVVDDLRAFEAMWVFKAGRLVAERGRLVRPARGIPAPAGGRVRIRPLSAEDLRIRAPAGRVRAIGLVPDQITTEALEVRLEPKGGLIGAAPEEDILKVAVVERHRGTGNVGLGLVKGFGLWAGALASSVAHDAHNLIAVGADDADLLSALEAVAAMGGGLAVVGGGKVLAELPLPVAGLMTGAPATDVADALDALEARAKELGARPQRPFGVLSFLALPVIPERRVTDLGVVDVNRGAIVPVAIGP